MTKCHTIVFVCQPHNDFELREPKPGWVWVRLSEWLGRDRDFVMEKLGCKIRPIGPRECMGLVVDLKAREVLKILKWFEDRAIEFIGEVDFTIGTVVKLNPHDEFFDMAGGCYSNHFLYSNGAII